MSKLRAFIICGGYFVFVVHLLVMLYMFAYDKFDDGVCQWTFIIGFSSFIIATFSLPGFDEIDKWEEEKKEKEWEEKRMEELKKKHDEQMAAYKHRLLTEKFHRS